LLPYRINRANIPGVPRTRQVFWKNARSGKKATAARRVRE